jgi:hypothetical protein
MLRFAVIFAGLCTSAYAQNEFKVKVLEVKGSAETRPAVDKPWTELKEGMTLGNNAWVQTGLKSRVYLKFGDNTVVQVKSATLLQITDAAKNGNQLTAKLKLALGNVHVEVQKSNETVDFKVVTPEVTTSVKGTGYSARHYSDLGSKVVVDHGLVRVDNRFTAHDLAAGKSATSALLPEDRKAMLQSFIAPAFDTLMLSWNMNFDWFSSDALVMDFSKDAQTTNSTETTISGTTTTGEDGGTGTDSGGGGTLPPVPITGGSTPVAP